MSRATAPASGAAWLERGGVYVVANIRGGGEFGPAWHQAALKENRQRAYDDFIAVAEDLVRRKVTSPPHLGIQGGTNGGLLWATCSRRPDLFGAVVCQVPLLDMQRYHKLLAGASWMGEYGDPDDPRSGRSSQGFSPYQNVKDGRELPADALHDLDPRRPRPPRPRPQDGGAHAGDGTTSSTTRTSRAATAARPTTSRRPTCRRWPTRSSGRSCGRGARGEPVILIAPGKAWGRGKCSG